MVSLELFDMLLDMVKEECWIERSNRIKVKVQVQRNLNRMMEISQSRAECRTI